MRNNFTGLSSQEAEEKLKEFGKNILPEKAPPSKLHIFLSQLKNPLVYVLLGAGVVTIILKEFSDTVIISIAVLLNTILGYFQEERANKALSALKKLVHPKAKIIRDGKTHEVSATHLVPGDIVILEAGTKIPADGKLVESNRLFITEAILTGESVPVNKKLEDTVFMGTLVSSGRGVMEVTITGQKTEMGKIALFIQEPETETPLKKQLREFSSQLTILVLGLTSLVFFIGILAKRPIEELFITSVSLAVSSIPEGLLIALTVVLAIGMQRILARKGLVRQLVSAETLGGVTTICVDKTGTLTEGNLRVSDVVGDKDKLITQSLIANDMDDPIVIAAYDWAVSKTKNSEAISDRFKRLDTIPFSSESRFFATLAKSEKETTLFVNGAPDNLLEWSTLNKKEKQEILNHIEKATKEGYRVVGFATKEMPANTKSIVENDVKRGLNWVGFMVFSDPIRPSVSASLDKALSAGLKIIVITGDYAATARAVLDEMGHSLSDKAILTGTDVASFSDLELQKVLKERAHVFLFARTTPEQKLKIVSALKHMGEVVAMMGDGVNDAPALNRADIGIVVNSASDVSKETADLILLNSDFETIVAAIEEGRGIFDNMRKIVLYLMSDGFEEIIAVLGSILLGFPLPVTASQILWINLVSDGLPSLALTVDPKIRDTMKQPPRDPREKLVNGWMRSIIAIISLVGGIIALVLFVYTYSQSNDIVYARSVAFAALGVNSLVYVFSVRTLRAPFWKENPLENKWLNFSIVGGLLLQFLPFISPLRPFFHLAPINSFSLTLIFGGSFLMFILIEITKHFVHARKM